MPEAESLQRTPLYSAHCELNAKIVPFAGYEMPVQYTSIMDEARAVRSGAGMFDVSHMARLGMNGVACESFLEGVTTNDVSKLTPRTGQYSLLTNEAGGCVDDIIVYRLDEGFQVVVNASNHEKDLSWLRRYLPANVDLADQTSSTAMIAVQGPSAVEKLSSLSDAAQALNAAPAFGVVNCTFAGVPTQAARSGYTGEDGYELVCAASDAIALWKELLDAGVTACGLGSRDTLRVEAGLPLYGHELSDELNPLAAGLGWVISKTKKFVGFQPIEEARQNGTPLKLVGIRLQSKRLAMPGTKILVEGESVGEVSSGVISPMLDTGIALAFIRREVALETPCVAETRGKTEPGLIVNKRFYKRPKS